MAISLIVFAILAGILAREAILDRRAKRKKAELEASFLPHDGWIREENNGTVEYALLDRTKPLWRVNSHLRQPESFEREAHIIEHAPRQIASLATTVPLQGESKPDLIPLILKARRSLTKGKTDAGKTTLLLAIASYSKGVIVIDPHAYPDKWSSHCQVIGGGRNFPEIYARLNWLYGTLDSRYTELASGKVKESQFDTITLLCDEVMDVIEECPDCKVFFRKLVTQGRKVNIDVHLGSHSLLVKALGLEGLGDVRENFLFVRLYFSQITGLRSATIDDGEGEIPVSFMERQALLPASTRIELPELKEPDLIINSKLSARQMRILDMIREGATDSTIAQEVYGKPRLVGSHFYEVKDLRDTYT